MSTVGVLYFGLLIPLNTLPYPLTSLPLFFNNFQNTSLYPLPLHLTVCDITDALSFSSHYCEYCCNEHWCTGDSTVSCPGVVSPDQMLVLSLVFLRISIHTVFHSGCTNFHSHQQYTRVPVSPHHRQLLLLLITLNIAILTGVR
jgi:hypothetical protein